MKKLVWLCIMALGLHVNNAQAGQTISQNESKTRDASHAHTDHIDQMLNYVGPFSYGFMVGAGLSCLETEIVNPVVSYVLKGWSDFLVVATEAGIFGGAGYALLKDKENSTTQTLQKPATLLGVLAGAIAWYHLHG